MQLQLPVKCCNGSLAPDVKVLHCPILRSRDQPVWLWWVKIYLIHSALVLLVILLLHSLSHFCKVPHADMAICCSRCKIVICNHSFGASWQFHYLFRSLTISRTPGNIVTWKTEVKMLRWAQVADLFKFVIFNCVHFEHWKQTTVTTKLRVEIIKTYRFCHQ